MTTVLVLAEGGETRRRWAAALRAIAGMRPVEARGPGDPAREVEATRPDVVLLDLGARALRPASLAGARIREVASARGSPFVVVLVERADASAWAEARRGGVRGLLPRTAGIAEVAAALGAVATGLVVFHPDALDERPAPAGRATTEAGERLSLREREVLGFLAEGFGNKAIAAHLGISTHTVKFHVAAILGKLGAGTRAEAVTIGVRRGLLLI